jgi:hypothetical protein
MSRHKLQAASCASLPNKSGPPAVVEEPSSFFSRPKNSMSKAYSVIVDNSVQDIKSTSASLVDERPLISNFKKNYQKKL